MLPSFLPAPGEGAFLLCSLKGQSKYSQGQCSTVRDLPRAGQQGQCWGGEFAAGMVNLLRVLGQVIYSPDAELLASCVLGTADCHCLVSEGEARVMKKGHNPSDRCKIRSSHQPHDLLFHLIKLIKCLSLDNCISNLPSYDFYLF